MTNVMTMNNRSRATVLLVDPVGDPGLSRIDQYGYRLQHVRSYQEALRVCTSGAPALLITEMRLGSESGLDLIREVFRRHPDLKAMIATAYPSASSARAALSLGVIDYVTKPLCIRDVLRALGADVDLTAQSELHTVRTNYIGLMLPVCGTIAGTARALGVDRRSLRRMLTRLANGG